MRTTSKPIAYKNFNNEFPEITGNGGIATKLNHSGIYWNLYLPEANKAVEIGGFFLIFIDTNIDNLPNVAQRFINGGAIGMTTFKNRTTYYKNIILILFYQNRKM